MFDRLYHDRLTSWIWTTKYSIFDFFHIALVPHEGQFSEITNRAEFLGRADLDRRERLQG
jgi:hypothetical protein